jgi:hypothetical protein
MRRKVTQSGLQGVAQVAAGSPVSAQNLCKQLEGMGALGYLKVGLAAKQRFNASLTVSRIVDARNRTARNIIASIGDA